MNRIVLLIGAFLLPFSLISQPNSCTAMLSAGKKAEQSGRLSEAVQEYLAALNCDSKLANSISPNIRRLFDKIEQQRKNEAAARKLANQKQEEAEENLALAIVEQEKNQRIIDKFYFYADRFALANKDDQFGYIDKEGNERIGYNYTEASSFALNGYARVKANGQLMLLDTFGTEYLLATSIDQLTEKTQALDLSFSKPGSDSNNSF